MKNVKIVLNHRNYISYNTCPRFTLSVLFPILTNLEYIFTRARTIENHYQSESLIKIPHFLYVYSLRITIPSILSISNKRSFLESERVYIFTLNTPR